MESFLRQMTRITPKLLCPNPPAAPEASICLTKDGSIHRKLVIGKAFLGLGAGLHNWKCLTLHFAYCTVHTDLKAVEGGLLFILSGYSSHPWSTHHYILTVAVMTKWWVHHPTPFIPSILAMASGDSLWLFSRNSLVKLRQTKETSFCMKFLLYQLLVKVTKSVLSNCITSLCKDIKQLLRCYLEQV